MADVDYDRNGIQARISELYAALEETRRSLRHDTIVHFEGDAAEVERLANGLAGALRAAVIQVEAEGRGR